MTDSASLALAQRLGASLLQSGMTLVTAESCTGGGIAHLVTSVAGSSQWFERGFVTYSNKAKQDLLGVSSDMLERYGAVSKEVAAAMAVGALHNSHAAVAVSVTGIAGPDGGSPEKPVGTVWFSWAGRDGETRTAQAHFQGDREQVRNQATLMAVQGLLDMLEATSN